MAMGRGSDTRIYAPRSESDTMYSSANEDESRYGPTSSYDKEKRMDERKEKEESRKTKLKDIKHIKIKPSQGLLAGSQLETEPGLDDGNKRDDEREMGLQGGPAGSRGTLLDLATGAKSGTGSSMGSIMASEPMDDAWSELLKEEEITPYDKPPFAHGVAPLENISCPHCKNKLEGTYRELHTDDPLVELFCPTCDIYDDGSVSSYDNSSLKLNPPNPNDTTLEAMIENDPTYVREDLRRGEPMDNAWSELLKEDDDENVSPRYPGVRRGQVINLDMFEDILEEDDLMHYDEMTDRQRAIIDTKMSLPAHLFSEGSEMGENLNRFLFSRSMHESIPDHHYENELEYLNHYKDAMENNDYNYDKTMEIMNNGYEDHPEHPHAIALSQMYPDFNKRQEEISNMYTPDDTWRSTIETGEPMDSAWSELLKEEEDENVSSDFAIPDTFEGEQHALCFDCEGTGLEKEPDYPYEECSSCGGKGTLAGVEETMPGYLHAKRMGIAGNSDDFTMSEPMANAWSTLMKRETPSTMAARRRREKRQEFRPSTGQFKTPPGGMSGGAGATMRRFKGQMRGIKGSKKTGLMKPHLSVEMSHRGIATKQPMSKDPQKYGQYMGQSEARKRLGNVRTVFSPHARHSARSFSAGPTGAGRLSGLMPGQQGLMSRPSLQRMRAPRPPRMPRVRRPPMPMAPQMAPPMSSVPSMPAPSSSMMMSEDRTESDFLKSNRHAGRTEYLKLMRELMRLQRERLNKAGTASAFEEGAVPAHPAGVHQHEDEDEKNDGPTQNLETNSSRMGLDPAGYLVSRRGHMG